MAAQGVSGLAVGAAAGGIVLLWSGLTGRKVTDTLRALVSGQKPAGPASSLAITANFDASAGTTGTTGTTGTATAPTNASEKAFWSALLSAIGAPDTAANQSSLHAWYHREEPSWPPPFSNNPLNSTQPMGGSHGGGTQGNIQYYPDSLTGVKANAQTLTNGLYPGIVAALRSGKGLCGGGLAGEFSKWSGGGYTSVC
jgi:hypothetical protein